MVVVDILTFVAGPECTTECIHGIVYTEEQRKDDLILLRAWVAMVRCMYAEASTRFELNVASLVSS